MICLCTHTWGATWAKQWTLWERQPEIPDSPCSDALVYSNRTSAMYFGHPGELEKGSGSSRSNYTILRSLDEGASWHFLEVVFSAGSGYSDMHLLPRSTPSTRAARAGEEREQQEEGGGDLIGVAFQMSTSWENGEPEPPQYNGEREHMSMGWAVVRVPPP